MCIRDSIMIEADAAAAATATSSDWLSMLSISLSMSVHIWCGVRRVGLARVIVYYRLWVVWPSRTVHDFAEPRTGIFSAVQLSSATFATQKVCKLLLQIARLLSKVKVSKLFSQLFAPIKSVHEESCEKSLQTLTFFATFCSHKKRCDQTGFLTKTALVPRYFWYKRGHILVCFPKS